MRLKRHAFSLAVITSGLLVALTFYFGQRVLVNGSRTGRVEMTGYVDSLRRAPMDEPTRTVANDPKRRSATVSIYTDPPGARVIVSSDSIGRSPIENYRTRAGVLLLTLEKSSYAPLDTIVLAEAGRHLRTSFELEPRAPGLSGVDSLEQSPVGESSPDVSNGESAAEATEETTSSPASESGNGAASAAVPAGAPSTPTADASGAIRAISTPSAAALWIDGERAGTTPIRLSDIEPGTHRISFEKTGYEPLHTTVQVQRGSTETVEATLSRTTGTFRILVKPWGSIYIDGKLHKPDTDLQYTTQLPVGRHHVRVVHPQLGIWERPVEISADTVRDLVVDLTEVETRPPE